MATPRGPWWVGRGWAGRGGEHSGGAQSWMGGTFAPPPPLGLSWEGKVGPRACGPQPHPSPPDLLPSGPCDKAVV